MVNSRSIAPLSPLSNEYQELTFPFNSPVSSNGSALSKLASPCSCGDTPSVESEAPVQYLKALKLGGEKLEDALVGLHEHEGRVAEERKHLERTLKSWEEASGAVTERYKAVLGKVDETNASWNLDHTIWADTKAALSLTWCVFTQMTYKVGRATRDAVNRAIDKAQAHPTHSTSDNDHQEPGSIRIQDQSAVRRICHWMRKTSARGQTSGGPLWRLLAVIFWWMLVVLATSLGERSEFWSNPFVRSSLLVMAISHSTVFTVLLVLEWAGLLWCLLTRCFGVAAPLLILCLISWSMEILLDRGSLDFEDRLWWWDVKPWVFIGLHSLWPLAFFAVV